MGFHPRLRFAPSPTGKLHLGGLRTALFNYFFAKKHHGQLFLRIEDTDKARSVAGAASSFISILNWTGIKFDPYVDHLGRSFPHICQSSRLDLYRSHAKVLLDKGFAYRCYCPKELSPDGLTPPSAYGGTCRSLSRCENPNLCGKPFAIRLKVDQSLYEDVQNKLLKASFRDLVYGDALFGYFKHVPADPILLKSDGTMVSLLVGWPTYHLANVVDDHEMNISHVLRGSVGPYADVLGMACLYSPPFVPL
ncbi:hypothetical protein DI09_68p50 [Mitosporidium daphniae]|uniref:Glutamyl/glutaminyl-tRNA synthetase class Ib catalytic domain-containing protein n=1 Tax=Mitosporidium daphniae TaxID=1485682 RepID=A0A098VN46_9MICR|nr:uncharacterized protein DI09_68p50 [Mitosporidium daphniae]KGG50497.1 hypothetical protein DI09_68p50 [Mitosporidium daphniae]|eukprot:XP_013236944.1 uncharacterized protein DI09_68p50 [Mitosporidium daphniae]